MPNIVYVAIAGLEVNGMSVLLGNFVLNEKGRTSNPLLHIHSNRWHSLPNTLKKEKFNMNKIRVIGLVILIIGIIIQFALENDTTDFVSGLLIGAGIGLILTGKVGRTSKIIIRNLSRFIKTELYPEFSLFRNLPLNEI